MKLFNFLLLILITTSAYTQRDTDVYTSETMYTLLETTGGEILRKVPFGKEVTVTFDYFFKTLNIDYQNIDRENVQMSFYILRNVQNKALVVKDDFENQFSVMSSLDSNGQLYLQGNTLNEDGSVLSIKISNAIKQ